MRALLLTLLLALPALAQEGHHHHHDFHEVEKWVRVFEQSGRNDWQKPAEVVAFLAPQPGQTVADIGAGSGYFTRHFARAVGPQGKALAVELEQAFFGPIRELAKAEGLDNVEPHLASADDPNLAPASVDLIFLCDTAHHIDHRIEYYRRLKKALKPGGRVVIVDFFKNRSLPVGPSPEMRLSWSRTCYELGQAGFSTTVNSSLLPYQYIVVAR